MNIIFTFILTYSSLYLLGWKFYHKGDYRRAVRYFSLEYSRNHAENVVRGIIDAYTKLNDFENAARWSDTLMKYNKCEALSMKGYFLSKLNRDSMKIDSYFDKLKIKCSGTPYPFYYHSLVLFERNQNKALKLLKWAYKKDSTSFQVNFTMGVFYYLLKDYVKSSVYFERALESKFIKNPRFLRIMGEAFYKAHKYNEAIQVYDTLCRYQRENKLNWIKLAKLNLNVNRVKEALRAYKSALKLDKDDADLKLNIGVLYVTLNDYDRGRKYLEQVVADSHVEAKNKAIASYYLGFIYYKSGYERYRSKVYKEAMEMFLKAENFYRESITLGLPSDLEKEAKKQIINSRKGYKASYRKYHRIQ